MPNLISLTFFSLKKLDKVQVFFFNFWNLCCCNNSRTSNDTGVKIGSLSKLEKKNTMKLKKATKASYQSFLTSYFLHVFFSFSPFNVLFFKKYIL